MSESEKQYLEALGKKISTRRKEKNISQDKLVALCDIEKANLSRIENGRINPTVLTLKKIASVIFDSFDEMFVEQKASEN